MLASCALLSACNDDDETQPTVVIPVEQTPKSISLEKIGHFATGVFDASAAEIPAFDPASKRGFVVNAQKGAIDVLDLSNPATPKFIQSLDATAIAANAVVNSVAIHNGIVAVAIESSPKTANGFVGFYKASDLSLISSIGVGALPDMLTFTPDGKTVLVANEGEPSDDYQIDPEGSISVINVNDITKPSVRTADFKAWNGKEAELRVKGVRIFGPKANAAQDFEPEYITVSEDGQTAWVALQENNALAKIDIANATVTDILPLGFKDHGIANNAMDASDEDNQINIQAWQGVRGLYLPDAISSYRVNGKTYIVTANEGDARAWGENNDAYWAGDASKGFVEEFRVKHLVHKDGFERRKGDDLPPQLQALANGAELNPVTFGYCGATADGDAGDCRSDTMLGRLNITWTEGYQKKSDGSPKLNDRGNLVYDHLYSFGGRSFSIWDENGQLVWDSGAEFEHTIAKDFPQFFNSGHDELALDSRSDAKGPEPEGIALGKLGNKTFAFVGLERMGGVMVYDISNPTKPVFVQYINTKNFDLTDEALIETDAAGDLGPEGLVFIAAKDSPNGKPLLMMSSEVSGTTAIFQIQQTF
ncbi:MAG: choice-of-anchor I family protein [Pseudomonadota bacterium]|nr:choice-of-anchor I family protein [Pseudomonadota bacterium]